VYAYRERYKGGKLLSNERSNSIFKVCGTFAIAEEVWNVELNHEGLKIIKSLPYSDRTCGT
jgi:hypothetical protein